MFVGQVSGPAGAHLVGRGVVGQVSVAPSGTKTGTSRCEWPSGAVLRQPTWLMSRQMRYFSLFNSA